MLTLAFDTTSPSGGAGIFCDAECLARAIHEGPANYSIWLFEAVQKLLRASELELCQIDLFAAANGPGSFTGIRVGLAAGLGWASAFSKPLYGFSVLEAMVEEARPETHQSAAILDARRGEFYGGLFRAKLPCQLWVSAPQRLVSLLKAEIPEDASTTCISKESDAAALTLEPLLPKSFRWTRVSDFLVPAIAQLAYRAWQDGTPQQEIAPCYIRRSDAELHWKDQV